LPVGYWRIQDIVFDNLTIRVCTTNLKIELFAQSFLHETKLVALKHKLALHLI